MKRVTVVAKGEVQRVGYRDEVERAARKLKISGFVENIKPYDVRIVAEGGDANIDRFIEQIKIKKYPIDVEDIEVSFDDFKDEFEYFEIKRGEWQEELGERLDAAGRLLYKSVELGEKSVKLAEESVHIGRTMLEKQDDTIAGIRKISEKIDQSKEETVTEIKSLREDLRSYMGNRFSKIEREIMRIKMKIGIA